MSPSDRHAQAQLLHSRRGTYPWPDHLGDRSQHGDGQTPHPGSLKCFIIISEYNRSIQGFLVHSVERIINMNWESILPPPKGAGRINYMTAVTG